MPEKPLGTAEVVVYLIVQQMLWYLLTWGAGNGQLWWPSALTAVILAAACWRAGPAWWRVLALIGTGIGCGFAVDGSLGAIGVVTYAGGAPPLVVPPLWILALWALCAATIALPARRLLTHTLVAALAGAVIGPAAYAGGRALGAITFSPVGLLMIGVCYAVAVPVLVLVANRLLPAPPTQRPVAGMAHP